MPRSGRCPQVECGIVGGEEDGIGGEDTTSSAALHDAGGAASGCGGTGHWKSRALPVGGDLRQRPRHLRARVRQAAPRDPGPTARRRSTSRTPARAFEYVFHGSSGSSPEELRAAVDNGVVKVNLDTEAQYAFTRAAAAHMIANREGVLRGRACPRRQARLRPAGLGRQGRVRDGAARGAGMRGARLGRAQHRLLIRPRPYPTPAAPTAVPRLGREWRAPEATSRSG